jgi:hypothetical protein
MKLALALSLALIAGAAPAAAIEQNCRFIQAKAEREACYAKQEAELAAKRKPEPTTANNRELETMQLMRREDAEVYRSMRSICRGC